MTEKERLKLRFLKYLEELEKHLSILKKDFKELQEYFPLNEEILEDLIKQPDTLAVLDQIAYRFIKLQDTLGKAIKLYFTLKGENVDQIPIIDVINLAERYDFPITEELWWELRSIRNSITHDYPDNMEEKAEVLNILREKLEVIEKILEKLKEI